MISKGSPIIFLCHPYTTLRVHPKLSQQKVIGADTDHGGRIYSFNPVTAGFVAEPWHWIYSSARDYHTDKKGLLNILFLDGFKLAKISNK